MPTTLCHFFPGSPEFCGASAYHAAAALATIGVCVYLSLRLLQRVVATRAEGRKRLPELQRETKNDLSVPWFEFASLPSSFCVLSVVVPAGDRTFARHR